MNNQKEPNFTKIKPVYYPSVIVFSLFWACVPFGYVINIISLIISLIYHRKTLEKITDDEQIKILKKNHRVFQYSFFAGIVLGIIITLCIFNILTINIHIVFIVLYALTLTIVHIFLLVTSLIHFSERKKYSGNIFIILNAFIIFVIIIIVLVLAIPNMVYTRRYHPLSSCSGNLRNLGIIITNYSTDNKGHYPQNLKVLEEQGYIENLPTCPLSDKEYRYIVDGWKSENFTVSCPNPEEHIGSYGPKSRTASLYYSACSGVNQVDMDREDSRKIIKNQRKKLRERDKSRRIFIITIISSTVFIGGLVYLLIFIYYKQQ